MNSPIDDTQLNPPATGEDDPRDDTMIIQPWLIHARSGHEASNDGNAAPPIADGEGPVLTVVYPDDAASEESGMSANHGQDARQGGVPRDQAETIEHSPSVVDWAGGDPAAWGAAPAEHRPALRLHRIAEDFSFDVESAGDDLASESESEAAAEPAAEADSAMVRETADGEAQDEVSEPAEPAERVPAYDSSMFTAPSPGPLFDAMQADDSATPDVALSAEQADGNPRRVEEFSADKPDGWTTQATPMSAGPDFRWRAMWLTAGATAFGGSMFILVLRSVFA